MYMAEALEWAADYCERNKIFAAPLNERGYVKDGWVAPTPEEKRRIITELAREVSTNPQASTSTVIDIFNDCASSYTEDGTQAMVDAGKFILKITEHFNGR